MHPPLRISCRTSLLPAVLIASFVYAAGFVPPGFPLDETDSPFPYLQLDIIERPSRFLSFATTLKPKLPPELEVIGEFTSLTGSRTRQKGKEFPLFQSILSVLRKFLLRSWLLPPNGSVLIFTPLFPCACPVEDGRNTRLRDPAGTREVVN